MKRKAEIRRRAVREIESVQSRVRKRELSVREEEADSFFPLGIFFRVVHYSMGQFLLVITAQFCFFFTADPIFLLTPVC